ncbi:MAG: hypothetical protein O7E52_29535 [Candidatus Poribacteria bacterium]|nr:hypothetical protein [Candidatus Poribacteria bacterium]
MIDPHGDVDIPPPPSEGFQAVDLPTNNGSAWTYVNVDTGQEFTVRIEGTRDISGFTHRQMTYSELDPPQLDGINREVVDHLSANSLYFRLDSDFFQFPFPLFATYFLKSPQSYIESAFDVFISFIDNPVFHQKHFPSRLIWDFPLHVGKEWTVFESQTTPPARVIRRVIGSNVRVTIPAGNYDAYLIEEEIDGLSQQEALKQVGDPPRLEPGRYEPARYWVVPNVGVVKYQYTFFTQLPTTNPDVALTLVRSATFELSESELPGTSSR